MKTVVKSFKIVVAMGIFSWAVSSQAQSCDGSVLKQSSQQLLNFNDGDNNLVSVTSVRSEGAAAVIVRNSIDACLNAKLPDIPASDRKCPSGCCESSVKRSCKTVITRYQEKALKAAHGNADLLDQNLPKPMAPNPSKGIGVGSLIEESGLTPFPCVVVGQRACSQSKALEGKSCKELTAEFNAHRAQWVNDFTEAVKNSPGIKSWNEDKTRCKDGKGKTVLDLQPPVCRADGTTESFPTVSSISYCLEGGFTFSMDITSRVQAITVCDGCSINRSSPSGLHQ